MRCRSCPKGEMDHWNDCSRFPYIPWRLRIVPVPGNLLVATDGLRQGWTETREDVVRSIVCSSMALEVVGSTTKGTVEGRLGWPGAEEGLASCHVDVRRGMV